jgi:hypothetical protein
VDVKWTEKKNEGAMAGGQEIEARLWGGKGVWRVGALDFPQVFLFDDK